MEVLEVPAEVKMRLGCLSLQNPPLKIGGPTELADEAGITGAPTELQEPLLWKPLGAEDFEIYEELYRDQGMIQARADAEQLFLALFRRLLFREDNVLVEVFKPPGLNRKQRLRQIFSALKQILKLKLCSIPISVLRLLAHRIYVACVTQGCSAGMRPFGLMEQDQGGDPNGDGPNGDSSHPEYAHLARDRTRVCFTRYPRLHVGNKAISKAPLERSATPLGSNQQKQPPPKDEQAYPFSFFSQQKVSGTERRGAHGEDILYARVDGSSGLRPAQFDDLVADVLGERGSLQHLRFLICMLRHFFTLSQKSLFIALALGDFNRKRHAQIFIQTMRAKETEGEVSRKLALKRMVNKSREQMPESTDDYLEYDFNSPRPFDLTIGITRCEEFLNSTTWTGSALQRMRSQLDYTLAKQMLTRECPTRAWQQSPGELASTY
ncbi:hypothetical protein EAH_00021550 [Eimeria acervulina]|uniref:Uncharacterized protein n=1 Tax=Eimeria acervulina TaxID=5801 RepID=U6GMF9_EIMAC|nr:hypothetical protein EAH_00021550 [Eimeria acervulina]CDI81401.1 hypothetical protein EAH_00021550 [Eimeria acervulina]